MVTLIPGITPGITPVAGMPGMPGNTDSEMEVEEEEGTPKYTYMTLRSGRCKIVFLQVAPGGAGRARAAGSPSPGSNLRKAAQITLVAGQRIRCSRCSRSPPPPALPAQPVRLPRPVRLPVQ